MTSRPSLSRSVMIARSASVDIRVEESTSSPSTRPAKAAFASPGPIDSATSMTVTGFSYSRVLPSGRVIFGILLPQSRGEETSHVNITIG